MHTERRISKLQLAFGARESDIIAYSKRVNCAAQRRIAVGLLIIGGLWLLSIPAFVLAGIGGVVENAAIPILLIVMGSCRLVLLRMIGVIKALAEENEHRGKEFAARVEDNPST